MAQASIYSHANAESPASPPSDEIGQALAYTSSRHLRQAKLRLAIPQNRLNLRIAFEAFGHAHHAVAYCVGTGCLMVPQEQTALPIQCLPALHEGVGPELGIGAKLCLELHSADCGRGPSFGRLTDQAQIIRKR